MSADKWIAKSGAGVWHRWNGYNWDGRARAYCGIWIAHPVIRATVIAGESVCKRCDVIARRRG